MSNLVDLNPYGVYNDLQGRPLNNGKVYIGLPNQDPTQYPAAVFWDPELTIPAAQPLRTVGGYVARNGTPAKIYINGNYSLKVTDQNNKQIFYVQDYYLIGSAQPVTKSELAASSGASLVGYTSGVSGSVARLLPNKLSEVISVKDFGAKGDGVTDDTAALQSARNYAASQSPPPAIIFPSGIYKYSVSPNWGYFDATVIADGEVKLRYTGVGDAVIFDGGSVSTIYNVNFLGQFVVEATTSAKNGFFVRSIHHSRIQGRCDGCGPTSFGLYNLFSVCTIFEIDTSVNSQGAWYSGARPYGGIYVSQRNAGELTTACTFNNPIIEGLSGDGIILDYASNNVFYGGTSEGNTGAGVSLTANSVGNCFFGIDFESNTGNDIYDTGKYNCFFKINSTGTIVFLGNNARLSKSTINTLTDNSSNAVIEDTAYSNLGGTLSGTPTNQTLLNVFNAAGFYEQNKTYDSVIGKNISVPTATATTVLTLTNVGSNRFYHVVANSPGVGNAYAAYALIYRDGSNAYIVNQTNGANLSITISSLQVKVTQTSGITLTVNAKASAI